MLIAVNRAEATERTAELAPQLWRMAMIRQEAVQSSMGVTPGCEPNAISQGMLLLRKNTLSNIHTNRTLSVGPQDIEINKSMQRANAALMCREVLPWEHAVLIYAKVQLQMVLQTKPHRISLFLTVEWFQIGGYFISRVNINALFQT